jgi:hypothetical protein
MYDYFVNILTNSHFPATACPQRSDTPTGATAVNAQKNFFLIGEHLFLKILLTFICNCLP